jgi:hypothetical protein
MKNLPDTIYLQTDPENESDPDVDFNDLEGVTWCQNRINETDIAYSRAIKNAPSFF